MSTERAKSCKLKLKPGSDTENIGSMDDSGVQHYGWGKATRSIVGNNASVSSKRDVLRRVDAVGTRDVVYTVDHGEEERTERYVPLRQRQLPASFWQEPKASPKHDSSNIQPKSSSVPSPSLTERSTPVSSSSSTTPSASTVQDAWTSSFRSSKSEPCLCCLCTNPGGGKDLLSDSITSLAYPCCYPAIESTSHINHANVDLMPLYSRHLSYPTVWENVSYTQYHVVQHQQLWRPIPTKSFSFYPHRFRPFP